mgnify:FL=1
MILYAGYVIVAALFAISTMLLFFSRNKNEAGKPIKTIGALYMTMNNPYFEVINEEVKAVVESRGDVLETRDSAMDAKVQAKQVERFIKEKVDCILINAVDWKNIGASLEKAKKAGIPVIAVDTLVYNQSLVDGTVISNNYEAGQQCAQDLMKRRKSGKILFLVQSENKSAIDRIKGFKETLEKAGWKYEDVGDLECKGQLEVAQPLVENVLNKTKDIDVVMALNDPSAMGAMAALDAQHMLSEVLVYGADGSPEAKTMIYENRMTATSAQSPQMTGKKTVEMLYNILDGKTAEKQFIVPVTLITKDNVDEYSLSGWQ